MNPTYKEYVIDFADLKLLSIVCKNCKAEIILNIDESDLYEKMPRVCIVCGEDFGKSLTESMIYFQKSYKQFTDKLSKANARMRIRREVNAVEF